MDDNMEERLSNKFSLYILTSDFDKDLQDNSFNKELYDKLTFIFQSENYEKYILDVKGTKGIADHIISYIFGMSSLYEDEIFEEETKLELKIVFTLEEEIYSISFEVDNGTNVQRLQIGINDIMIQALNKSERWVCIEDEWYIKDTIVEYTTKYNLTNQQFEITLINEENTIYGVVYYYKNMDEFTFIDSFGNSQNFYLSNLSKSGFSIDQINNILDSVSIINDEWDITYELAR